MRTGRGFWLAAISLSLTLAAHVLPWLFTIGAVVLVLLYELAYRYGLFEHDGRAKELDSVTNRLAVLGASLCIGFVPFFFDTAATTNSVGFLSTRESPYSLIFTLLLALFAVGRIVQVIYSRRGYVFTVLAAVFVVMSFFVALRFALAMILVMTAAELVQRRDLDNDERRTLLRGDQSRPMRFALGAGLLSVGLSAWWLFPFAVSQSLTDSLGYTNVPVSNLREIFSTLGWFNSVGGAAGDRWIICAGVRRGARRVFRARSPRAHPRLDDGRVVLGLRARSPECDLEPAAHSFLVHLDLPRVGLARGLHRGPLGELHSPSSSVATRVRRGRRHRSSNKTRASGANPASRRWRPRRTPTSPRRATGVAVASFGPPASVAILGLGSTVPGLITPVANFLSLNLTGNQVSAWAADNYAGYQAQTSWPEYHDIITTMQRVSAKYGCGRAMWEYSSSENRFGTPEALMLLPYWTDNCVDSMEGLLMESSPTTPYHYLDQSELSVSPSDPQVGLNYGPLDVAEGVRHLQILGVKYFMAFSPAVFKQAAAVPDLKLVATTKTWPAPGAQWRIYLITHSPMVQSLGEDPNVVANISSQHNWLSENEEWWLTNRPPERLCRRERSVELAACDEHQLDERLGCVAQGDRHARQGRSAVDFVSRESRGCAHAGEDLVLPALARDRRDGSLSRESQPDGGRADIEECLARLRQHSFVHGGTRRERRRRSLAASSFSCWPFGVEEGAR